MPEIMQNETQATSLRLRLSKNIVFEQPLDRNHASDRKFGSEPRPTGHNSEPSCIKTVIHAPGFYGDCGAPQSPILCALRRERLFRQAETDGKSRPFFLYDCALYLLQVAFFTPSANTSWKPLTFAAMSPPNTAEPATITSAPAATISAVLFSLAPPSISSSQW